MYISKHKIEWRTEQQKEEGEEKSIIHRIYHENAKEELKLYLKHIKPEWNNIKNGKCLITGQQKMYKMYKKCVEIKHQINTSIACLNSIFIMFH